MPGRFLLPDQLRMCFAFLGWFWTHGGQTLGMKTWKLKLVSLQGGNMSWRQAGLRFVAALFSWLCGGLGFIWSLFDKQKRCWHDRVSATRMITLQHRAMPATSIEKNESANNR